ncbi:hypothetical protein C8J56DRAFT_898753 [Mycena floridula]|nr:hypothetical protein C8J56DRAFT_898753 [Mycena floridula]
MKLLSIASLAVLLTFVVARPQNGDDTGTGTGQTGDASGDQAGDGTGDQTEDGTGDQTGAGAGISASSADQTGTGSAAPSASDTPTASLTQLDYRDRFCGVSLYNWNRLRVRYEKDRKSDTVSGKVDVQSSANSQRASDKKFLHDYGRSLDHFGRHGRSCRVLHVIPKLFMAYQMPRPELLPYNTSGRYIYLLNETDLNKYSPFSVIFGLTSYVRVESRLVNTYGKAESPALGYQMSTQMRTQGPHRPLTVDTTTGGKVIWGMFDAVEL